MSYFGVRWWYGSLYTYLLIFSCLYGASGYQILPVREVVNKALFISGDDNNYYSLSPILAATSQISSTDQLLFTFMNFTCSGMITRLIFVAQRPYQLNSVASWPVFSLWKNRSGNFIEMQSFFPDQASSIQPAFESTTNDSQLVKVFMINITPPIQFESGYVLGLRQNSLSVTGTRPHFYNTIKVLRQSGGYGLTLICGDQYRLEMPTRCPAVNVTKRKEMPYIAVETTPPSQRCAMGFLNEQSLIMIVKAARNDIDLASFSFEFPGILHSAAAMSMSVGKVGPLRKIVIAARVNVSVAVGWPELQIIRTISDETPNTVFTTNTTEPKPTGYLNLYEYDLVADKFDIQDGDTLNISWHGNVLQHDQIRFSLAYYNNGTSPAIPMVSLVVGDCDPETNLLSLNHTPYCEDVPVMATDGVNMIRNVTGTPVTRGSTVTMSEESTFTTQASINSSTTSGKTIIISGAVVFSLLLLLILLFFVVLLIFVVKRRRKSASVNVIDPIEMSGPPRMLHNTPRCERGPTLENDYHESDHRALPSNGRSPTLENDYLESDDRAPSNSAPASAIPVAMAQHDNQQDDYYYYKLYEWGVFVPTADQRGKLASSGANNDDAVYSTLGESQYSKLQQFNKGPEFFENADNYWKPASDTEGLYQQLSRKKYREILRQQIQLSDSLGSGQFGNVMKGVWLLSGGSKEVAVKMLKEEASETEKVRFLQEAAINGQFHHPNVVKLMGVVTIGEPVMIILEFLSNGDLRGYLMKIQPTPGEMAPSNTPHTLLRFCKEIAAGMKYLAGKGFIHRDLAARNILVSEEKTCKISDFGMSRDLEDESYYISHGGVIPVKWTAPEALHYKKYSSLSDVWSFGCVVYEIWSLGHKPFEGYSKHEVIRKVDSGFRLPPPPGCPRDIYHIMIQCWHPNKNLRPSFSDLHTSLSDHTLSLGMKEECHTVSERPDQPLPLPLHPQAHTIGAPLEAGKELYNDLQKTYISE